MDQALKNGEAEREAAAMEAEQTKVNSPQQQQKETKGDGKFLGGMMEDLGVNIVWILTTTYNEYKMNGWNSLLLQASSTLSWTSPLSLSILCRILLIGGMKDWS